MDASRLDEILRHLRLEEVPEALRFMGVLEAGGSITADEAEAWRSRIRAHAAFLELGTAADEGGTA